MLRDMCFNTVLYERRSYKNKYMKINLRLDILHNVSNNDNNSVILYPHYVVKIKQH